MMRTGYYGIFNDESANWTEEEAIEAGFLSEKQAKNAIDQIPIYRDDDTLIVHEIEDEDEDEDDESEYPIKY